VYSVDANASATVVQMAATGVFHLGDTRLSAREAGSPPSRAKAYIMREVEVTQARPQR